MVLEEEWLTQGDRLEKKKVQSPTCHHARGVTWVVLAGESPLCFLDSLVAGLNLNGRPLPWGAGAAEAGPTG